MFGGRKSKGPVGPAANGSGAQRARLPDIQAESRPVRHQLPPHMAGARPPPIPPPRPTAATGASEAEIARAAEEELLAKLASFRSAVADALYEISNDYRILCNLAHADLKSCDGLMQELRERLATDTHYRVLAKLDEAHAMTASKLGRTRKPA